MFDDCMKILLIDVSPSMYMTGALETVKEALQLLTKVDEEASERCPAVKVYICGSDNIEEVHPSIGLGSTEWEDIAEYLENRNDKVYSSIGYALRELIKRYGRVNILAITDGEWNYPRSRRLRKLIYEELARADPSSVRVTILDIKPRVRTSNLLSELAVKNPMVFNIITHILDPRGISMYISNWICRDEC